MSTAILSPAARAHRRYPVRPARRCCALSVRASVPVAAVTRQVAQRTGLVALLAATPPGLGLVVTDVPVPAATALAAVLTLTALAVFAAATLVEHRHVVAPRAHRAAHALAHTATRHLRRVLEGAQARHAQEARR